MGLRGCFHGAIFLYDSVGETIKLLLLTTFPLVDSP